MHIANTDAATFEPYGNGDDDDDDDDDGEEEDEDDMR